MRNTIRNILLALAAFAAIGTAGCRRNGAAAQPQQQTTTGQVRLFLAGDSTVKDYSADGMWNGGTARNEGAWGEFLPAWLSGPVSVRNYANGGRSTRSFINEGSLDKIAQDIGAGDYLFIQFGHNDCSNGAKNLEERFVPLGKPNRKGTYPVTAGKKTATPDAFAARYGAEFYPYTSGTFKWYLKQYIDVARKAGATPVLVTPVSRVYFAGLKGTIEPHHDAKDTSTGTQVTTNDAYVEAVRQLAKEENVTLIDGFALTKRMYEQSFADTKKSAEAFALMFPDDKTHNNKLGGFIIAGEFATAIREGIPALAPSVSPPANVIGRNTDGTVLFSVDADSAIDCPDAYWKAYAQRLIDALKS